jgi:hypothetical protein
MKSFRSLIFLLALLAAVLPAGCGSQEREEEHGHEESSSGASFNPGKGVILTDETRKILGVEVADVTEEKLPRFVRFNVQIFGETHRFMHLSMDHTGCDIHGSGFLPPEKASLVESKQPVKLLTSGNETMDGFVVAVKNQLAHGETEIIVGVTGASEKLKDGEFAAATITLPRDEAVTVVPRSALLRTAEGTFVYTVNGGAYYRTVVKVGSETDDKIEITDGLFTGDQVVTQPVETLWLIELRATKGGGHSH